MSINHLVNSISWKLEKHRDLKAVGLKHNILLDFIWGTYKKRAFENWLSYPSMFAYSSGCAFTKDTPSRVLKEIFVDKVYNVEGFLPDIGEVVLDVGANYGDSTIWWAKTFGAKVIAFEPLDNVYEILCNNIEINQVSNVEAHKIALGRGNTLEGYSNGDMFIAGKKGNPKYINSMPLDEFHFERLNLLKIDVEGFEVDVLEGGLKTIEKYKPRIIIEVHSTLLKEKCDRILTSLGYRLSIAGRTVKSKSPGMDLVQNLFYSPNA